MHVLQEVSIVFYSGVYNVLQEVSIVIVSKTK